MLTSKQAIDWLLIKPDDMKRQLIELIQRLDSDNKAEQQKVTDLHIILDKIASNMMSYYELRVDQDGSQKRGGEEDNDLQSSRQK